MRTYLYKLTSDRGGAPCAPPPRDGEEPLLTLSICKPAIRRTAQVGDRIVGLTSRALVQRERYPAHAVVYAAVVTGTVDFGTYYAPDSGFQHRPDCVYLLHPEDGMIVHSGRTALHEEHAYAEPDLGRAPLYRNARSLLCADFRYFGGEAVPVPARFTMLRQVAKALGQGHRVFEQGSAQAREADRLFAMLWKRPTRFTPSRVEEEIPGHAPRGRSLNWRPTSRCEPCVNQSGAG